MWGLPWAVSIEPNNTCNLQCSECPTGNKSLTREKGQINLADFDTLINHLPSTVFYVNLYFQGEPLLHSDIIEIIRKLKARHIYVSLATNGHFLNETLSRSLVDAGLDCIIVSLDGFDQDSYEKYRVNGDFHRVVEGINNITQARSLNNKARPLLVIQSLLLQSTEYQVEKIKQLSSLLHADKLEFKSALLNPSGMNLRLLPEQENFRRYYCDDSGRWHLKSKLQNHCFRMWTSSVIVWDGRVVPCCFDKDVSHGMGDIIKKPLQEIWRGSEYLAFRKKILTNRKSVPICNNCIEGTDRIKQS